MLKSFRTEPTRKNSRSFANIELHDLSRFHSQAETERDDAACGSSGDQVKMINDVNFQVVLDCCQHSSREDAFDAAAIERQNLKLFGLFWVVHCHVSACPSPRCD